MMIRSRMPSCSAGGIAGLPSVVTAGPGAGWAAFTGGTTRIVRSAFRGSSPRSARGADVDLGEIGRATVAPGDQPGEPDQQVAGGDRLVEPEFGALLQGAGGGDREALQRAVGVVPGTDLHRGTGGR